MSGTTMELFDDLGSEIEHPGEIGELYLSGDQLTSGYLSSERDPKREAFTVDRGKEFYRTGDRCFRGETGDYFFAGRVDLQVKVHGFRVELNEIQYFASAYTGTQSIALFDQEGSGGIHLFLEDWKNSSEVELRNYLKKQLPFHSLPQGITILKSFIQTQNGKVDRADLKNQIKIKKESF